MLSSFKKHGAMAGDYHNPQAWNPQCQTSFQGFHLGFSSIAHLIIKWGEPPWATHSMPELHERIVSRKTMENIRKPWKNIGTTCLKWYWNGKQKQNDTMISIDILMYSLNISQFYHTIQRYKGCKEDASVELIRLNGAGHQWPLGIPWSQRRFTPKKYQKMPPRWGKWYNMILTYIYIFI